MKKNKDVSIVIPVYKSVTSIEVLAEQLNALEKKIGKTFQIMFINDSPFFLDTNKTLKVVAEKHNNVEVITLRKNQGQHIALLVGLKYAVGKYVITMDDDLQHPVNELPKLINTIYNRPDVDAIFAVPSIKKKKHSLWRNFGSYVINRADGIFLSKPDGLIKSPFRIMRTDLAQVIVNNYNSSPAVSSLMVKATNNIINIEVEHKNRQYGKSGYSMSKLLSLTLNNILHYSSLPLKFMGYVGLIGFLFSVFFISIILIRKLFFDINFPGYASIVTLISFFGGLNLLAVGVIGEYLIRIVKEQQKPHLEDLIRKES